VRFLSFADKERKAHGNQIEYNQAASWVSYLRKRRGSRKKFKILTKGEDRPLKNVPFCSRPRKAKILTT